jgi:sigma-B regulation protein RsbU (phosphoserine phosphatase)
VADIAKKLIAEQKNTPNDVIEAMTAGVNAFVGEAEQSDDLTMLAVKYMKR